MTVQKKELSEAKSPGEDTKIEIVSFGEAQPQKWKAQRWRRISLIATFIPFVLVPVVLSIVYFGFIAADKYSVEVKFAIRSPTGFAPADVLGLVTGVSSSGSTVLDSYIVSDYIESGGMLEKLEERIDLRSIYGHENADFLMRFDGAESKEDFLDYFGWMRTVYFDTSSQVITVKVMAFTPEDANLVANEILLATQELVNRISVEARLDTVRTAQQEVTRAEEALRKQRVVISAFREEQQDIDPMTSAGTQQTLLATIEGELAAARSERDSLLEFLSPDSPQIRIRNSKINALLAQIETQKSRLGSGTSESSTSLTQRVGNYEEIAVDLEFLQRAYLSALASLEGARLEADRQQRYVATFVHPTVPEEALYPRRIVNCLLVAVFAFMAWGIATMGVYIVREHTA